MLVNFAFVNKNTPILQNNNNKRLFHFSELSWEVCARLHVCTLDRSWLVKPGRGHPYQNDRGDSRTV